jgi:hypothetical protein
MPNYSSTRQTAHSAIHLLTQHPLTHSLTHPPTLLLIFPWQFYLFTALYQLPHCYWCDLSRVLLAYQPTVNKDVPEFKQMTHARRSKYLSTQRSFSVVLSAQRFAAWAFNDPTSNLKVNSHWPRYSWSIPAVYICVCVCVPLPAKL